MRAWVARNVRAPAIGKRPGLLYSEIGMLPLPCDCTKCGEPGLIFPPEDGAWQGYCICPRCSFPTKATNAQLP